MTTATAGSTAAGGARGDGVTVSRPAGMRIPATPGDWRGAPPVVVAQVQAAFDTAMAVWREATTDVGELTDAEAVGLSDAITAIQRHLQAAPDRLLGEIEDRGLCYRGHSRGLASWLQQRYQLHPTDAHMRAKAAHANSYDLTQPGSHRTEPEPDQPAEQAEDGHSDQTAEPAPDSPDQAGQPDQAGDAGDTGEAGGAGEPFDNQPCPPRPGDQLARARAAGELTDRQHELVLDALRHIPATVDDAARIRAEAELLHLVVRVGPAMFRDRAELIIDALDPYAARENEKRAQANRGLTIGHTRDGLATLKGQLTRPAAALLRTVLHPAAAPETDHTLGQRTYPQRNHDAFHAWLRGLVPNHYTYNPDLDRMIDPHPGNSTEPAGSAATHTATATHAATATDASNSDGEGTDDAAEYPGEADTETMQADPDITHASNSGGAGMADATDYPGDTHPETRQADPDTTGDNATGAGTAYATSSRGGDEPTSDTPTAGYTPPIGGDGVAGQLGLFARPGRDTWRHILANHNRTSPDRGPEHGPDRGDDRGHDRGDDRDRAQPPGAPPGIRPARPPDRVGPEPAGARTGQSREPFDVAGPPIGIGSHRGLPARLLIIATLDQLVHGTGLVPTIHGGHIRVEEVLADLHNMCVNVLATDSDGAPLRLARTRRTATSIQRMVLAARDRGCVIPDCEQPARYTDAHHIQPWAAGGHTDIDNLALLCRHHHRNISDWHLTYHRGRIWATPANEPDAVPRVNTKHGEPPGPPPHYRPARGAA